MGNEEPVLGCMEVTHKGFGVGLGPEITLEIFHALGFCTNIQLVKGIIASGVGSVEIGPGTRGAGSMTNSRFNLHSQLV